MSAPHSTRAFEHLVLDIHGVLVVARPWPGELTPGKFIARLREAGCRISFLTNASSLTRAGVADALRRDGILAVEKEVFTAGMTVAHYLCALGQRMRLYLIGTPVFRDEIQRACGDRAEWVEPECADFVVVSRDANLREETLARLRNAQDACLLATCRDGMFVHEGRLEAGPGPTVERVERAMGRSALVIGKPNPYVLTHVIGLTPQELRATLVVGDSPDQDVGLGRNAGCRTVLMTEPTAALPSTALQPDFVTHKFDDLVTIAMQASWV